MAEPVRELRPFGLWLVSGRAQAANTIAGSEPRSLWLAPGRVLVVADHPCDPPEGDFVSEITDGHCVFAIDPGLLALATPLPLPAPGTCAQTLIAGVKVLLYPEGDVLRLHVERPLAHFLLAWLTRAAEPPR